MFPLRDDNPTLNASVITIAIITLNILTWIFIQGGGLGFSLVESIWSYGLLSGELLQRIPQGTRIPVSDHAVYLVEGSRYYTLITSMFMHGGWLHLLGNMWFLFVFGDNVEDAMGPIKFIFFYLVCGLSAAALQMVFEPGSSVPMVGASGAIGGIMGAYARLYPRAPVHTLVFIVIFAGRIIVPAFVMLGYWFFLQLAGGLFSVGPGSGGVAVWAHVGGFVAGFGTIRYFCNSSRLSRCKEEQGSMRKIFERYGRV